VAREGEWWCTGNCMRQRPAVKRLGNRREPAEINSLIS
jgi:hypothetical protein